MMKFPANTVFRDPNFSGLLLLGGYLAGVSASLLIHHALLAAVLFTLAGLLLALVVFQQRRIPVMPLLLLLSGCLGLMIGSVRLETLAGSQLKEFEGRRAQLVVAAASRPGHSGAKVSFTANASLIQSGDLRREIDEDVQVDIICREQCREMMEPGDGTAWEEGTRLRVSGTLRQPPASPGSDFDYQEYLRRRGIQMSITAGADGVELLADQRGGFSGLVDRLRQHARGSLAIGGWGPAGALLQGMVLGDDDQVPEEVISDFRDSGLLHLLAVSGENVILLGLIVMLLCRTLLIPKLAAAFIAIAVICVYMPLTGGGPSIVRAGIVGILGLSAYIFSRQTSRYHFLALSAAVILSVNPYNLLDPGFQLSFGAVLSIFLVAPAFMGPLAPLPAGLREGIAISAAAGLVTSPITLAHFHQISLLTVPANVAAALSVGPVMLVGVLSILVSPLSADLSWLLNAVGAFCTAYLIAVAHFFARLPGSVYTGNSPGMVAIVLFYAMLSAMVFIARRMGFAGFLAWLRKRNRIALAAAILLVALAGFACLDASAGTPSPTYMVSVLDVGQGDAVLLHVPGGANVLIDGGPGSQVTDRLAENGVERLDAVILTHPHSDHLAGLIPVLEKYPVDAVIDAAPPASSSMYRDFLKLVDRRGMPYTVARRGQVLDFGELHLKVVNPSNNLRPDDTNANSVVVLASYRGLDILLPGDAEGDLLSTLDLSQVEAFKVPHHGSKDGSLKAVLDKLKPGVAVISVGEGNVYGHPAQDTIDRLKAAGSQIYRTDQQGTISLALVNGTLEVRTQR